MRVSRRLKTCSTISMPSASKHQRQSRVSLAKDVRNRASEFKSLCSLFWDKTEAGQRASIPSLSLSTHTVRAQSRWTHHPFSHLWAQATRNGAHHSSKKKIEAAQSNQNLLVRIITIATLSRASSRKKRRIKHKLQPLTMQTYAISTNNCHYQSSCPSKHLVVWPEKPQKHHRQHRHRQVLSCINHLQQVATWSQVRIQDCPYSRSKMTTRAQCRPQWTLHRSWVAH